MAEVKTEINKILTLIKEIDGKDILMLRQKCRADKKYEESLSKGKIRRLLSSVVTSLQELRKDFVVRYRQFPLLTIFKAHKKSRMWPSRAS